MFAASLKINYFCKQTLIPLWGYKINYAGNK